MNRAQILRTVDTPVTAPAYAPVAARFTDREVVSASHIVTDLTLGRAVPVHDYLTEEESS